jgi:hypothetical protein
MKSVARREKRELTVQIQMQEHGVAGMMGASEPDASGCMDFAVLGSNQGKGVLSLLTYSY